MRSILRVMIDEKPAFFIVGCWESGTNIVQDIVNRHPAICRADNGPRADAPVKVVHVIRDGRDAAVAAWQRLQRLDMERQATFADHVEHFALEHWVGFIEQARAAASRQAYLELRYEALHTNPYNEIRRLLDFLGLEATAGTIRTCFDAALFQGTIGEWRRHFDDDAAFRFDAVAGYLLRELGYVEPSRFGIARAA